MCWPLSIELHRLHQLGESACVDRWLCVLIRSWPWAQAWNSTDHVQHWTFVVWRTIRHIWSSFAGYRTIPCFYRPGILWPFGWGIGQVCANFFRGTLHRESDLSSFVRPHLAYIERPLCFCLPPLCSLYCRPSHLWFVCPIWCNSGKIVAVYCIHVSKYSLQTKRANFEFEVR